MSAPARPQRNGWLKAECGSCGMKVRMTRRAAQKSGMPTCGCGGRFAAADDALAAALAAAEPPQDGSPFERWAKTQAA